MHPLVHVARRRLLPFLPYLGACCPWWKAPARLWWVDTWTPPEHHRCSWINRWTLARTAEKMHSTAQSSSSQRTVVKVMVSYRILYVSYWILIQHSAGWISQDMFLKILPLEFPWSWEFGPCTVSTDAGKAKKGLPAHHIWETNPDEGQYGPVKSMPVWFL